MVWSHLSKGQKAMAVAMAYPEAVTGRPEKGLKIKPLDNDINKGLLSQSRKVLKHLPAALASYAKQAKDTELEIMAARIKARAIRRCGELLRQVEPAHGANQNISDAGDSNVLTRTQAAQDAGLSHRQQFTALRVANVPDQQFNDMVEADKPATITQIAFPVTI